LRPSPAQLGPLTSFPFTVRDGAGARGPADASASLSPGMPVGARSAQARLSARSPPTGRHDCGGRPL